MIDRLLDWFVFVSKSYRDVVAYDATSDLKDCSVIDLIAFE